jgi:hypothetical protein
MVNFKIRFQIQILQSSDQFHKCLKAGMGGGVTIRVTRFGVLSPTVQLFTLGSFQKLPNFGLLFNTVKLMNYLGQKMDWATSWVTFSLPHLGTPVTI